jgi:hypothetical protein
VNIPMQRFIRLVVLVLFGTSGPLYAETYQIQVAHVEEKLFFRYVETQGTPLQAEHHILPELETALDEGTLSALHLLPERSVEVVTPARDKSGRVEPVRLKVTLPQSRNPWEVVTWEGTPGNVAVLEIRSQQVHYQELREIAVDTNGILRRLPVTGVPLFGSPQQLVPDFAATYVDYKLERGTFAACMAHYAASFDGLSIIVGRNSNLYFPDTIYLLVQMPPQEKTYKVVLAWKDRETLQKGDGKDGGSRDD